MADAYVYDPSLTPYVDTINRLNGTTAGGTTIKLTGSGFGPDPEVQLDGVLCATKYDQIGSYRNQHLCVWGEKQRAAGMDIAVSCNGLGANDTHVTCLSNPVPNNIMMNPVAGAVDVINPAVGKAATEDDVSYSYANLWSKKTTWGGYNPPRQMESVVVTLNEFIMLDVSPPELNLIILQGTLKFYDALDIHLQAHYILVHKGRLQVGSQDTPFVHSAIITMLGKRSDLEIPVYGAKCIGIRQGTLDLHGSPTVSWTRLGATAVPGATHINLREPVAWKENDLIVITSTSYDQEDTETARIRYVHGNGTRLELEFPLQFEHLGDGWNAPHGLHGWYEDGDHIPEYSAEVGLLSRNVVVQGDYHVSRRQEFGVQIVIASRGDNSAITRIANTEVRLAGQGSKIGKYPIHFHMVGDVSKSYVKNSTVHHAFNRAIAVRFYRRIYRPCSLQCMTSRSQPHSVVHQCCFSDMADHLIVVARGQVHGVNNVTIEHNVAYDTRGHALFIEDGTEVNNWLVNNLIVLVRPVLSLLLVDQSPACYWIVHPYTHLLGNVAGGSSHYGYWMRMLPKPDGVSGQERLDDGFPSSGPMYSQLGVVDGNVAHSVGKVRKKARGFLLLVSGMSVRHHVVVTHVKTSMLVGCSMA